MTDFVERERAVSALEKALYSYEDETEARFKEDPELDLAEWFFHRIFVQVMNGHDRQAILDLPAADVRLLDADALRAEVKKHATPSDAWVFSLIRTAPTIIPTDDSRNS